MLGQERAHWHQHHTINHSTASWLRLVIAAAAAAQAAWGIVIAIAIVIVIVGGWCFCFFFAYCVSRIACDMYNTHNTYDLAPHSHTHAHIKPHARASAPHMAHVADQCCRHGKPTKQHICGFHDTAAPRCVLFLIFFFEACSLGGKCP